MGLGRAARPARALARPARTRICWSGRCRARASGAACWPTAEDTAHLVEALHAVSARLGGLPKRWRFDRMATVASPNTGRVTARFAAVAKHYGVHVDLCPPRHGNRKGTVEKANHSAAQRWWRTLPDDLTVAQAQASLDAFCARVGDGRVRKRDGAAHHRRGARRRSSRWRRCRRRSRRPWRAADRQRAGAGGVPRQQLLGPARPGRRDHDRQPPARRARSSTSPPRPGRCSPGTAASPTAPASWSATPSTSPPWRPRCSPRSTPASPAPARSAGHPAQPPWPRPSTYRQPRRARRRA